MTYGCREPIVSLLCGRRCAAQWLTEAASGQGVGKRHRNGWGAPPPPRAEPCGCRWAALLTVKILTG